MNEKNGRIKSLRFFIRAFWIALSATIAFHIGAEASKGPMNLESITREWHVPNHLSMLFVLVTAIILLIILILFISLGKRGKPQSCDSLDRLERLGKLKEQGIITTDEFLSEKKKILGEK